VAMTPFTLSGAMSPVTLAGALVQQHAEAMAMLALSQIAAPGAPVLYGGFTSNVDMRSGAPAFGTPEYTKAALAGGQLARRLGVPYRSSNVTASNCVDIQASYESMMSLWGAVMGGVNLIEHAAGWLEGGLTASFEKLVLDAELLQNMREFLKPIEVNEAEMGVAAINEVGPGGHFFGVGHTLERYGTPSRRASCPPASAALVYSGVPKAGAPERMSTFDVNPPYITGAPGEAICDSASMASASACCCTSAPARVTGLMAPESVKGVIATG